MYRKNMKQNWLEVPASPSVRNTEVEQMNQKTIKMRQQFLLFQDQKKHELKTPQKSTFGFLKNLFG